MIKSHRDNSGETAIKGGYMKKPGRGGIFFLSILAFLMLMTGFVWGADVTIKGKVDDQRQIIGNDGETYSVVENDMGLEIVRKHVGETVKIQGAVKYSEEDDTMFITPTRYEVLSSGETEGQGDENADDERINEK